MDFKIEKREVKHSGVVFDVLIDHITYPSGNGSVREVAKHPGGAVVVPMIDNKTVLLIEQYRYPIEKVIYELPAGKLEPGEEPEHCARRELEEETGYTAGRLTHLTSFYTTPGFCTEQLHIFLAEDLSLLERGQRLEEGESSIALHKIPIDRAISMIENQVIVDGKTIVALFLAQRRM